MLENELGPQRRMPKTPRPSAQLPAVSQPSQCGECDERNELTMETIDSEHPTAMPAAGAETDQPAHLRSRWTDTLLSLTPHAHTLMCRHLGIVNAAQPPDARLAGSSPRWSCVSENVLIRPRHAVVHGFRRDSPSSAYR